MSIFIKAGLWIERKLSIKGEFNLTKYIQELIAETPVTPVVAPYKVYTALLTQTGTNAPVATVLENTIGTITWGYADIGLYSATSTALYTENKTAVFTGQEGITTVLTIGGWVSTNMVIIGTLNTSSSQFANGKMQITPIEIRVYN